MLRFADMFTDKKVLELSVKILGEMMRSSSYDSVSPSDQAYQAVEYAIELIKSLKESKQDHS